MMRGVSTLLSTGLVMGLIAPAGAAVFINSNFNSAATGAVADNATVDGLVADVVTNTAMHVVQIAPGDNAVQLTDNFSPSATTGSAPYLRKTVSSGLSTTGTGDNYITGSFELRRLSIPAGQGTEGNFRMLINRAGGGLNLSNTATLASIRVQNNKLLVSTDAANLQAELPTASISLAVDTTYRIEIAMDLSSDVQDTWRLRVKNDAGTLLYSSAAFNTPVANGTPGEFLFTGGLLGSGQSALPFVQIDDIHFSASPVPEPSAALLLTAGLFIACRRRRRV